MTAEPEVRLVSLSIHEIRPAPENELIYRPVRPDDPEIRKLAGSIRDNGLLEPIVVTREGFIISGHRRFEACKLLGMRYVQCRIEEISRHDPEFVPLLREHNRQRVKGIDEILRELVATREPGKAYQSLIEHRHAKSAVDGEFIRIEGMKTRNRISRNKQPMLDAVIREVKARRAYWPTSDRKIHYALLNDPPLRNARREDSRYRNDRASYQDLCDMLTRARLAGLIPFDAIGDPTRTVRTWDLNLTPGGFIEKELENFLEGYWRDLQQSQSNHVEIVGEKNTVEGSIKPVAMRFCIPYTLGRGYCSIDPRHRMAKRYRKSGRCKLIVLVLSDFDPEGEDIAHSFARSMRDDFGIARVHAKKVCLTHQQVLERGLPENYDIKKSGKRWKKFAAKYGESVYELEALPEAELSRLLTEAIDEVIDIDAFNKELDEEAKDAEKIAALRNKVIDLIRDAVDEGSGEGDDA
jgi:hypothetical protein